MRHTIKTHFLSYLGLVGIFAASGACFRVPSACCSRAGRRLSRLSPHATHARLPAAAIILLIAIILLAIPSRAQYTVLINLDVLYDMVSIFILGMAPRLPLPSGYCDAVAAQLIWANWSDSHLPPAERAAALVAQMTSDEKFRLVQGVGWRGWIHAHNTYHGNILAVPRLGIPSLNMQDAGQGWATTDRTMVDRVTS